MTGRIRKTVAVLLTVMMILGVFQCMPVYAGGISFYNIQITNITSDTATLNFWVNNTTGKGVRYLGCYLYNSNNRKIGTCSGYLSKPSTKKQAGYTMNLKNYYKALTPNTCYKIRLFVKLANGQEYIANTMYSFRTSYGKITFTNVSLTKLTNNDAVIQLYVNNPSRVRVSYIGFYLYDNLDTSNGIRSCAASGVYRVNTTKNKIGQSFDMNWYRYSKLRPNTTYYIRFYASLASGQTVYSGYYYFKTKK